MANKLTSPEKMKPSLFLNAEELPEVKNWEVGNEYTLLVTVKQTGKDIHEYNKKKSISAHFEICKIKPVDSSASSKDFKEFEKNYKK